MWSNFGYNLKMTEGDFGIALPVEIEGTTLGAQDSKNEIIINHGLM